MRSSSARHSGHSATCTAVAFAPDGARVLSGSQDGLVKLWNTATGQLIRTFTGHPGTVYAVAWGSNEELVISAGDDGMLRCWDVPAEVHLRHRDTADGPDQREQHLKRFWRQPNRRSVPEQHPLKRMDAKRTKFV